MKIKDFLNAEDISTLSVVLTMEQLKFVMDFLWAQMKEEEAAAQPKEEERYLDVREAGEMLGVTPNSLWRWNRDGYLKPIKVGRKNRYKLSEVKRILEGGNA